MSEGNARAVPGVREAEAWLLGQLRERADEARADLRLLARPVRVVVPGGPLREHFLDRMLGALGGAAVGIRVQTLWSLALEVLETAGTPARSGALSFELAARRAVAREPALSAELDGLEDGTGLAASALSDLLSARLGSAEPARLERALARVPAGERARATGLVQAARATHDSLREAGRCRYGDVYEDAARTIEAQGERALPSRAVYVHGFSGATGQAGALLRALMQRADARLLVVDPPGDPVGSAGSEGSLAQRFARRIAGSNPQPASVAPSEARRLAAFHAWGEGDELREVALRIRALLESGARPESIGVVARDLEPRALALRRAFEEHGVPFGGGVEPIGLRPELRRFAALLALLRLGGRAPADRWLDALEGPLAARREELRQALRASGVARWSEIAALTGAAWLAEADRITLPHRGAVPDGEPAEGRPRRRQIEARHLRAAADAARRALEIVERWPAGGSVEEHAQQLERLVTALGAGLQPGNAREARSSVWGVPLERLEELGGLAPGPSRAELASLLERAHAQSAQRALGGAGAGVRVLSAQEARGATFAHLFLVGLERGTFPRVPRPDPLLPDPARAALAEVLPDLELKEHQHAEERWLFAALATAAPDVTLSWLRCDDEGREVAPSPFVQAALARAGLQPHAIARRRDDLEQRPPRSAREAAVSAALTGARGDLEQALELAITEGVDRFGDGLLPRGVAPAELAAARLEVLAEIEPDRRSRAGRARLAAPGPWLGVVGRGALGGDGPVFVTRLEALARCPWHGFLLHGLGIEAASDPLVDLPDLDHLLLGEAVHAALQLLLAPGSSERVELETVLAGTARKVARPSPQAIEHQVRRAAASALEAEGLRLPGLALALAARARPLVERGLELLGDDLHVLGAEVEGLARDPVPLAFRADLVVGTSGAPLLVDFKARGGLSVARTDATRAKHLCAQTKLGKRLQGMAYALAAQGATGAYLFLDPELEDKCARVEVSAKVEDLKQAFDEAVQSLSAAWRDGVVPPRPDDPAGKANQACRACEVRSACLRDDTGNRKRLRELAKAAAQDGADGTLAARFARLLCAGEAAAEESEG
jgi:hypothetical protein